MRTKFSILPIITLILILFSSCNEKINYKFTPADDQHFANIEVKGSYFDLGYSVGSVFRNDILRIMEMRREWFLKLKEIDNSGTPSYYEQFLNEATKAYPQYVDELRGMAEGSGIAFEDLFILNCQSELSLIGKNFQEEDGCSSFYAFNDDETIFLHNEDGHRIYSEYMFVVKAFPESGVNFVALCYPGLLLGNGPALNSAGIGQAVNFISQTESKIGIPRYFLNRAVLETRSLEEAVSTASNPQRAFAYHHNLISMNDLRCVSLELTANDSALVKPEHLYYHTNHLISEKLAGSPQDDEYVNTSSMSRYLAISEELTDRVDKRIDLREGLAILSSHRYAPFSPCRHPEADVTGATLATVVFDLSHQKMMIFKGNPCQSVPAGAVQEFSLQDLIEASW